MRQSKKGETLSGIAVVRSPTLTPESSPTAQRESEPFTQSGLRRRAPMPSLRTVERLGTYMVDEKIGSRDGTDVYRCSHALTKEPALAKVLYQSEDPDRRTAFEQEVEALVAEGACVLARGLCTAGPYVVVEDFGPVLEKRLLREKP